MAIIPGVVLNLLADVEKVFNEHIEKNADSDLRHWFPLSLSLHSHDDHIATLFEEGWDLNPPLLKKETK